jgi:hypothetical protein
LILPASKFALEVDVGLDLWLALSNGLPTLGGAWSNATRRSVVLWFFLGGAPIPPDESDPIEMWERAEFDAWDHEVSELRERKK